ncbi:hypothetical protein SCP_1702830 [Sparassis crispa]|uniref:Uncharacterized protein n=1 Tax=Sparassis crispa TaxID=139825 RepID=A0A401H690_9APHY|nr:hypothetical protein SCP_1702830 [Sparassis crispa]GBE89957.1 hypothetical protein SCP_1702830 [Sparassis crispa]
MSDSIEARLHFIENLHIPALRKGSKRAAKGSGAVNAGSTQSFVGNLSELNKEDVLNSTLLAQLAANTASPDDKTKWYKKYKEVLENVGWVVSDFTFKELDNANSYGSVDQAILAILKGYLEGNALEVFKATIDAMKNPVNSGANNLFQTNAWKGQSADFLVGVATESNNDVQFRIGTYTYQAQGSRGNVLFFKFGHESVKFMYSTQNMVLNEKIYAKVRDAVINKLGGHIEKYIDDLDIGL